ncbi:MAG TPA: stage II sporulation protein M [Bacteroidota bacterium]|nr:stage II sporulation protein M [Bacteroidota bacterium]
MGNIFQGGLKVRTAISRARLPILSVAAAYSVSIVVGIFMVHFGNPFALDYRDKIVGAAAKQDPAAIANNAGNNFRAALIDFAGNLVIGSMPKAIMGMGIVFPYPLIAFQGWVGGIVSVRGDHTSRLNSLASGTYYLLTLILQISAYSLAVGAGVNVGRSLLRPPLYYQGAKLAWIFPKEAIWDLARIYLVATPAFLLASLWEFLSPWNI